MIARLKQALTPRDFGWAAFRRKNILAGAMFMAIAIAGLWISRNYPVGTAVRMGTGYMPRLLLWLLLGLGAIIALQGLRDPDETRRGNLAAAARPLISVFAALFVLGLSLERLGLVVSILLLVAIASFAARELRLIETVVAAVVLVAMSWAIFILGLGLTIPVWPSW